MERIDDPSNIPTPQAPLATVSPGAFRRPSVLAGDQGTILTGDWANDVQENIIDPILAAGLALSKGDATQLTQAINILSDTVADGLIATHLAVAASESVSAHIELASAAEVLAGTDVGRAVSAARWKEAIAAQLADPGYIRIPTAAGLFTIQFGTEALVGGSGTADFDVTLPVAYSTAHLWAIAGSFSSSLSESQNDAFAFPQSLTQIRLGSAQANRTVYWLSIGQ